MVRAEPDWGVLGWIEPVGYTEFDTTHGLRPDGRPHSEWCHVPMTTVTYINTVSVRDNSLSNAIKRVKILQRFNRYINALRRYGWK